MFNDELLSYLKAVFLCLYLSKRVPLRRYIVRHDTEVGLINNCNE